MISRNDHKRLYNNRLFQIYFIYYPVYRKLALNGGNTHIWHTVFGKGLIELTVSFVRLVVCSMAHKYIFVSIVKADYFPKHRHKRFAIVTVFYYRFAYINRLKACPVFFGKSRQLIVFYSVYYVGRNDIDLGYSVRIYFVQCFLC